MIVPLPNKFQIGVWGQVGRGGVTIDNIIQIKLYCPFFLGWPAVIHFQQGKGENNLKSILKDLSTASRSVIR